MIRYNISPIPTTYAGVNFRSRLEARYAAFFDQIKWVWEYEPIDSCDGWIQDFRVYLPAWHSGKFLSVLIEVKPAIWMHDFVGERSYKIMNETQILPSDAVGVCGENPSVGYWLYRCKCHHRAIDCITRWIPIWKAHWLLAGNIVQWRKAA